ncbi:hypothetical protein ACJMK2_008108 [Sinanodonta woodiana]|uniref:Uncharacterized protein n=1 Tax=Sinanodonta woodiana TaxID=1069815 RepID=A0ABD3VKK0_SINWO
MLEHDSSLLAVGIDARQFIDNNIDNISPTQLSSFIRSVMSFYEKVTAKMLAKFPFNDQILKALVEDVLHLCDRIVTANDRVKLKMSSGTFQLYPASGLPSFK